jgi:flavodoxin
VKALVLYYSRSGHTRKAAEEIATALGADIEELKDNSNRGGPIGFLKSGREARAGATVTLEPLSHDPSAYDVVVVGTPVWASTMSSPVRTLLSGDAVREVKVAWFCTAGATSRSMHEGCFRAMTEESGCTPVATLGFGSGALRGDHSKAVADFVEAVEAAVP